MANLIYSAITSLDGYVADGENPALADGLHLELELLDERRFANGVIYVGYRVPTASA